MHSTASDGALDPADLVARAVANGVQIMALTDHDTVAG
ncbi:MAG: PHP domain-containing protein, partial [Burkholderiaceae bacterium]